MSEFQKGEPPVGEAGMCVTDGGWFQYWNGTTMYNGSRATNGAADAIGFYKTRETCTFREWRWATVSEMREGGCTEEQILYYHHELGREQERATSSVPAPVSRALTDFRENSGMILRDTRGLLASTRQRIERRPVAVAPREHDPRSGLLVEPTSITIRQPRIMWGL